MSSKKASFVVAATVLASLLAAAPAQAAFARSTSLATQPMKRASMGKGFSPVRALSGEARAVLAVGNDVWVAAEGADGKVLLERSQKGKWSTSTLPVAADNTLTLSGTASNDVWLVSGGELWHYTTSWTRQALPAGSSATAVEDLPGNSVYVGTSTAASAVNEIGEVVNDSYAELQRFDGSSWTNLSGPELPTDWTMAGSQPITRIRAVNGQVFAETHQNPPSTWSLHRVFQVTGTTWTDVARTGELGHGADGRTMGWISYSATNQLFLGTENGEPQPGPICRPLINNEQGECTTSTAVGAAVKLADNRVVIGGNDWRTSFIGEPETYGQGTFRVRAIDGTETPLKGDPGDATIDMSTAGGVVWAITEAGGKQTLQRYAMS